MNGFGTAIITITVNDGQSLDNTTTESFLVTVNHVNQAPTLNAIGNVTINENAAQQTVTLAGITSGATNENDALAITATSSNQALIPNPIASYTSPNSTGTLSFAPTVNNFGTATITVTVNDGQVQNSTLSRTFTVTVNPVNQPPTINPLNNLTLNENAGAQIVNLSGITPGPTNEAQTVTVTATSSNPALIPNPTVSYANPASTGTLTLTPSVNGFGTATITVTVNDGQSVNPAATQSFVVTVNHVNQSPTLSAIGNVTINENAGPQIVNLTGITTGATNEADTLTVTATSSNPALIANPIVGYSSPSGIGTLSFTPAVNGFGTATVTVTVNDGQAQNNLVTQTFTVTVNHINQSPTLDAIGNVAINENAAQQTVNLTGITTGATNENDSLTIVATSSNPALIPNPAVNYSSPNVTGSLSFTPAANGFGGATITVTVNDGQAQNNTVTRTFVVSVGAVNQPPTINPVNDLTITENAGLQTVNLSGITPGPTNETQHLTVTAVSSNPALIPTPTVTYTSPNNAGTLASRRL